jgi:hypothetical protein
MPLRHGYTLTQIQGLAVQAARREWWHRTRDFHERTDIAWSGIVERLYTSDEPPAANDLAIAGMAAINQFYEKDLQQHGGLLRPPAQRRRARDLEGRCR